MFKNTPSFFFMIHGRSSGLHTFFKRGWTRTMSDLLAPRKYSICEKETCKNIQLVRNRGRNRDAINSASNRSIPTRAALEPDATAHVWCVWKCATRESNQFSQQHHSLEAQRDLLSVCVSGRCVPCRESFLDLHCRREQSSLLR